MDMEKAIKGLEWILQDDRFGFGVNWNTDCEPKTEEEQAGYNIQRAINLLKEQGGLMLALEQSNAANEYLNAEVERLNWLLEKQEPKQVCLYGKEDWYGLVCVCPDCGAEWMSEQNKTHFCPNCRTEVKWE